MAVTEMGIEIKWRCEQGHRTDDNRDCCGVGIRDDAVLATVLDGSSTGENSGTFARDAARGLIDWFVAAETVDPEAIVDRLRGIHAELSGKYQRSSASLVIIILFERKGTACILHAGDCLVGLVQEESAIDWLIQPHTLANPISPVAIDELAHDPSRNVLTRSFRTKEFMEPYSKDLNFEAGQRLVLATDGFWASLDHEQKHAFLSDEVLETSEDQDDCSALTLAIVDAQSDKITEVSGENFYVVTANTRSN